MLAQRDLGPGTFVRERNAVSAASSICPLTPPHSHSTDVWRLLLWMLSPDGLLCKSLQIPQWLNDCRVVPCSVVRGPAPRPSDSAGRTGCLGPASGTAAAPPTLQENTHKRQAHLSSGWFLHSVRMTWDKPLLLDYCVCERGCFSFVSQHVTVPVSLMACQH